MSSNTQPITLKILDKEYRIACPDGKADALRQSADILNGRINEVRDSGKVIGPDRIAVMAALNLVHEFIEEQDEIEKYSARMNNKLRSLHERIDNAIRSSKQLEI